MFEVYLSMCGLRKGVPFVFIPAKLRKTFTTTKEAQRYYEHLACRRFKASASYGVFLTIAHDGAIVLRQQIN